MERIALDLRKYTTPNTLGNIIADTASLSIEASNNPEIPKVNLHHYIKKDSITVISPGRDKRDVLEKFTTETELDQKATAAGVEIRNMLLNDPVGDMFVWVSPSEPYPESRIVVGVKKETRSKRFQYLQCYGISTSLSREDCLKLGQFLVSLASGKYAFPSTPEDLRDLVIKLDGSNITDPFTYLAQIVELPEKNSFKSIIDGSADKIKAHAVKAAVIATQSIRDNPNIIYSIPIVAGAYVENQMAYLGFEMNPQKFGCGASNNKFIRSSNYSETSTSVSSTAEMAQGCKNCRTTTGVACGWCTRCWETVGKHLK
jgi:hypothetical protein